MASPSLKPYFVTLGLMVATSLALAFTIDVNLTDQAGLTLQLPSRVGEWAGTTIRFCQNRACKSQAQNGVFLETSLTNALVCPSCDGKLDSLSWVERLNLPPDTEGIKKNYLLPDGHGVSVAIVLSGRERASIHRPEVCLRGQGNAIRGSYVLEVPMSNRAPLRVTVLEQVDENNEKYQFYYAYWFVGKNRETHSHWQRMLWMATDRIFHNVSHRWAYVSVAGIRPGGNRDYQQEIRRFIGQLYPQITLN